MRSRPLNVGKPIDDVYWRGARWGIFACLSNRAKRKFTDDTVEAAFGLSRGSGTGTGHRAS
jgi:hypothetical protein